MHSESSPPVAGDGGAWQRVGRELLQAELYRQREGVADAFYAAEEALRMGEELDAAHIQELRRALNAARRLVEMQATAVVDGVEPWGEPVPDINYGVVREIYGDAAES